MKVTLEIPTKVAIDLKRIMQRAYGDLSLAQTIATCVVFSLASSSRARHPNSERRYADLALKLIDMQPPRFDE